MVVFTIPCSACCPRTTETARTWQRRRRGCPRRSRAAPRTKHRVWRHDAVRRQAGARAAGRAVPSVGCVLSAPEHSVSALARQPSVICPSFLNAVHRRNQVGIPRGRAIEGLVNGYCHFGIVWRDVVLTHVALLIRAFDIAYIAPATGSPSPSCRRTGLRPAVLSPTASTCCIYTNMRFRRCAIRTSQVGRIPPIRQIRAGLLTNLGALGRSEIMHPAAA